MACRGNPRERCGGFWRMSVYKILNAVTQVPDGQMEALVTKYAPKVWLARGEQYKPSSVDFHLRNVKVYGGGRVYSSTASTLSSCSTSCYMSSNQRLSHASATLSFFSGEPVGPTRQPPVYAVWKRINSVTTDIFYWMFYPYNRGKRVCIGFRAWGSCIGGYSTFGHHVGDWEHMTARLVGNQPSSIYVSAHNFGGKYDWDAASQTYKKGGDTVRTEGTHPVLYSAKGSHGLWSNPGTHTYEKILKIEKLQDETSTGTVWNTWRNVPCIKYHPGGGYTGSWSWLNYQGRWGNRKDGCTVEKLSGECILNDGPVSINDRDAMKYNNLD
ncbi:putative vacuolar protein sorting-associated protein TDA6 [Branchiostoma floridae]|uniref:Vacuolar protein sorting-associated protein TDA6 n=1 Tax=Branchiostoma floridae TaxID=7739 RepID=A0A9J7MRD1_BRAFL|nr:putative vacuolar protein sorting-associated protein TDA6 [Branchiostoma floridae]